MNGASRNSSPVATSSLSTMTDRLSIQVRHARAVAVMLGATSRSADIAPDDVMWAADCVAALLDQVLAGLAGVSNGSATP